ncbi:DUF3098 domain-containing protein [Pontibacter akesuensis]|uniref:DUF3098 domain-containing protein n=1 Tax=Pontibacter akesuensis TaxID=388950 RepID=A0A1I7GAY2_9BACT|nr:DUF3098 domain-containing protein [Pontibacter akesuensis]GHA57695.1 hypothetical protein GCM10007389_06890 [Pontibacter akesuensis]SFU45617.1 Protein of unknown function [Pontibacter akesuensis]
MEETKKKQLAFGSKNYRLMLLGIALLIVGFIIMSLDTEPYGLGFLGITLGPLVVLAGFAVEIFAIMAKDKKQD